MNQQILITGAGRGLGFALTEKHLSLGDHVYALEYDIPEELTQLAKEQPLLTVIACDIGETDSVNAAMAQPLQAGKQLDILYNVAGLYQPWGRMPLAETDIDASMRMYTVNGVGLLRVTKAALPLIGKGSLIVNVTSEAGSITSSMRPSEYLYCMSKASANMATKILSNELHAQGVRVIAIEPGWMRSHMGGEFAKASPLSIEPATSAEGIMDIAARISEIPPSWMYMQYNGKLLPW